MEAIINRAEQRGVTLPSNLGPTSLLSASCGLGSTTVEIAEQVIHMLAETAQALRAA